MIKGAAVFYIARTKLTPAHQEHKISVVTEPGREKQISAFIRSEFFENLNEIEALDRAKKLDGEYGVMNSHDILDL